MDDEVPDRTDQVNLIFRVSGQCAVNVHILLMHYNTRTVQKAA